MASPLSAFSQSPAPSFLPVGHWQEDPFARQPSPAAASGDMTLRELLKRGGVNSTGEYLALETQPQPIPQAAREPLLQLQQFYTVVGDNSLVTETLSEFPALFSLLKEAVEPLKRAFGERIILQLEALQSEDGNILRAVVRLPLCAARPAELMRNFKRVWWLNNCSRSEGSLVFDYETGNGL